MSLCGFHRIITECCVELAAESNKIQHFLVREVLEEKLIIAAYCDQLRIQLYRSQRTRFISSIVLILFQSNKSPDHDHDPIVLPLSVVPWNSISFADIFLSLSAEQL